MFVDGVIGDNFRFLSVDDSDAFAFVFTCSVAISSCNVSASCVVLMLRYRRQSSATSRTVEKTLFGRSLK